MSGQLGVLVGAALAVLALVGGAVWLLKSVLGSGRLPPPRTAAGHKCPGCGLLNFPTAEACRRCGFALLTREAPPAGRLLVFSRNAPVFALLAIAAGWYVHYSVTVLGWLALLAGLAAGLFALFRKGGDEAARRGARRAVLFNALALVVCCVVPFTYLYNLRSLVAAGAPRWKTFELYEGRYRVDFPGEPSANAPDDFAPQFGTTRAETHSVKTETGAVCGVSYEPLAGVELPDPEQALDGAAASMLERTHYRLISRKSLLHEGHPALELQLLVRAKGGGPPGRAFYRLVLSPTHAYSLTLVDAEGGRLLDARERFFDSFHLLTPAEAAAEEAARAPALKESRQNRLHAYAFGGDVARVKELIAAGAEVNPSDTPQPPLLVAAREGQGLVVKALIEAGANVNYREPKTGDTALMKAATRCKRADEAVAALIKAGAALDLRNTEGESALIRAAAYGCPGMVRQLVAAGADLSLKDEKGRTALARARENQAKGYNAEAAEAVVAALAAARAPE